MVKPTSTNYLVNFTGTIKEGERELLLDGARKTSTMTYDAPGCQIYEIYQSRDPDRSRTILVFIEWQDEKFFRQNILSEEKQEMYNRYHIHVERNSIHGTRWSKWMAPNPFLSLEMQIMNPEPLAPSQGAFYPYFAFSLMAMAKPSRYCEYRAYLARTQALALQIGSGVIRYDIYDGVSDDNQGVTLVFGVFKTEHEMLYHLAQDFSPLSPTVIDMLHAAPHLAKWQREI